MTTDYLTARDEIYELIENAIKANAPSVLNYEPLIEWQGIQPVNIPDGSKHWLRVSLQVVDEEQSTLSTCEGLPGQKRFTAYGLVFVQIFGPIEDIEAFDKCAKLAQIAQNSLRGKATNSHVWFRNVRKTPLEPEQKYHRFNVVAEFQYDELAQ